MENSKKMHLRLSNEESNRFTRECLQTALFLLMDEKDFQKITITELVKRSGLSRMAFYRNYSSKEDIILDLYTQALTRLEASMDVPLYADHPEAWLTQYFEGVREASHAFSILLKSNLPPDLTASMSAISRKYTGGALWKSCD